LPDEILNLNYDLIGYLIEVKRKKNVEYQVQDFQRVPVLLQPIIVRILAEKTEIKETIFF